MHGGAANRGAQVNDLPPLRMGGFSVGFLLIFCGFFQGFVGFSMLFCVFFQGFVMFCGVFCCFSGGFRWCWRD